MHEYGDRAEYPDKPVQHTALHSLDDQLERFEKTLAIARERLSVVMSQYATDTVQASVPHSEPTSPLAARADQLRDLNTSFDELLGRLDI